MKIEYQMENGPLLNFKVSVFKDKQLLIGQTPQKPEKEKGKPWKIAMNDGTTRTVLIKNSLEFLFDPKIQIDGHEITVGRKLVWWEYLLCLIPVVLVFVGGLSGALCGLLSSLVNVGICRKYDSALKKILLSLLSIAVAVIAYLAVYTAVYLLVNR